MWLHLLVVCLYACTVEIESYNIARDLDQFKLKMREERYLTDVNVSTTDCTLDVGRLKLFNLSKDVGIDIDMEMRNTHGKLPEPKIARIITLQVGCHQRNSLPTNLRANVSWCTPEWAQWTASDCSTTCGNGMQTRERTFLYASNASVEREDISCMVAECPPPKVDSEEPPPPKVDSEEPPPEDSAVGFGTVFIILLALAACAGAVYMGVKYVSKVQQPKYESNVVKTKRRLPKTRPKEEVADGASNSKPSLDLELDANRLLSFNLNQNVAQEPTSPAVTTTKTVDLRKKNSKQTPVKSKKRKRK